jgi:hypothetical protein
MTTPRLLPRKSVIIHYIKEMIRSGNMAVKANDRVLWPIQVSALSGASAQSITNWRRNGYLDGIGKFDAAASRWNYSILDAIKLRLIDELATVGVRLPFAAAMAREIDQRVLELAAGKKPEHHVVVAWVVDGEQLRVRRGRSDKWLGDYAHSRPTIVVPIDNVASEIFFKSMLKWNDGSGRDGKEEDELN